jgi:hypothetical protein
VLSLILRFGRIVERGRERERERGSERERGRERESMGRSPLVHRMDLLGV